MPALCVIETMISVIVPYWNAETWIARCVKSLCALEGDFEFILINDHSTDNGDHVARMCVGDDDRFVFLHNPALKKGVSAARNTGLDFADGEWITFLDADDELVPEASEVFERMICLDETANIIQANHLRHYEKTGHTKLRYANELGVYHLYGMPFSVWPKCWCMVWNKLYRRSFLDDHQIRFVEGLQYGEDEIFNLACLKYDDRLFHTKHDTVTVMRHFDNKESLSRVKANDWLGLIKQSQALEDFILRTDDPKLRHSTYEILAEHWNSGRYQEAFEVKE